jgi:hypothetical protein
MSVDTKHTDYTKWLPIWKRIRDAIEGSDAIKSAKETYLPKLNGQDQDSYDAYLKRAQYVDFPSELLNTAMGQLFRKRVDTGNLDEDYLENVTLSEESFEYTSRQIAEEIMSVNRVGVLIDWSELQKRPYLTVYKAENIINWQTEIRYGLVQLKMVMFEGDIEVPEANDKYKLTTKKQWMELYIEEGIYKIRKWDKKDGKFIQIDDEGQPTIEDTIPKIDSKPFNFIPFFFLTSDGVSIKLQKSPLYSIININLGHYINSADYENMLHWTGARTIIARGWDAKNPFPVGSCATFPTDGGAEYLESSSDSALGEGMKRKEEQLAMLGSARISGKGRYVASAETANITSQGEYATLADIANAMSKSMATVMTVFMRWLKSTEDIKITYNTDYEIDAVNMQDLVAMSGLVSSNMMSWSTFFYNLKNKEVYPPEWTEEDEQDAIAETVDKQVENRDKKMINDMTENQVAFNQDDKNKDQNKGELNVKN